MKALLLLLLTSGMALGQVVTLTRPDRSKLFYPENYGAAVGNDTDDRAGIQAAADAAEATGGTVVLAPGTYVITTVNSPASGDKAAGAYGLEIPSNVALVGSGPNTVLSIVNGGAYGVGVGISPKGMRTATANFGAASNVRLADFTISAASQAESNGNLINLVHASDWIIERVHIGTSYFHGLEIDQSRRITLNRCTFSGARTSTSGSPVQFDNNLAGPVNRPATITTTLVEDVRFSDCRFAARPDTDTYARDIDANHAAALTLRNVLFEGCVFEGRAVANTTIVGFDANAATVESIAFNRCRFVTTHPQADAIYLANALTVVRRLSVTDCIFSGPSASFVRLGGSTSKTYNATHTSRHSVIVERNQFLFDKTQMVTSLDVQLLTVIAWVQATVRENYVRGIGDFPVSVGNTTSYITGAFNCLATTWQDNHTIWEGNNTWAVARNGQTVWTAEADAAGLTMGLTMTNNTVYSTAGTGLSFGVVVAAHGTTIPASRGFVWGGNFSNAANTASNGAIVTGAVTGGAASSGGMGVASRNVTANTTLTPQDFILNCDTTSGSITVTAPAVAHRQMFRLRKTSAANNLTLGSTTVTALNAMITGWSDGTTFYTVAD